MTGHVFNSIPDVIYKGTYVFWFRMVLIEESEYLVTQYSNAHSICAFHVKIKCMSYKPKPKPKKTGEHCSKCGVALSEMSIFYNKCFHCKKIVYPKTKPNENGSVHM